MTTPENDLTPADKPATDLQTTVDSSSSDAYNPLDDAAVELQGTDEVAKKAEPKPDVEDTAKVLPTQNVGDIADPFRDGKHKGQGSVPLPSDTYQATSDMIDNLPSVDVIDSAEWADTLRNGTENEVHEGTGYSRFAQPDGMFTNIMKTEGGLTMTGVYAGTSKNSNATVTGERALLGMMNYMKVGNIYLAPLWNSGFWVSVKPPSEGSLVDLMHLLRAEKVRLGRATNGLSYSSTTGVTAKYVIEFVKAHIYSTSINSKEVSIGEIEKYISVNDLDSLLLAIISSMYPNGFNYSRSCVADPVACNHLVEGIIDPSKLLYVNRRALTDSMIGHMTNRRSNSMSLKDVLSYQSQLAARNIRMIEHTVNEDGDKVSLELKTPDIGRYILSTDSWITDIETTADRVLSKEATDAERAQLIDRHSKATTMRQFTHYVERITYGDNTQVVDRSSIQAVMNGMSSDDDLSAALNAGVTELINSSTVAVVGIPTYKCPACKKPVRSREGHPEEYQNVIPLDLLSIFFDLAREKMARINRR